MEGTDLSDSEPDESPKNSSSDEDQNLHNGKQKQRLSEYERQRLSRIEHNKARMQALGLHKLASSVLGSAQHRSKAKGKSKMVEDDEYRPPDGNDRSSSWSDVEGDSMEDEYSGSRRRKAKKKHSKPQKKASVQKLMSNSDFMEDDDDDDLMQAIALSLKDSAEASNKIYNGPPQRADSSSLNGSLEDTGKKRRRKPITNRVQMTEDELVLHFFQFDESGRGNITLRDLRRVATAHDFMWTDKEMADMIHCFDSDGDSMLSLDDFRRIASQCNMIQGPQNATTGKQ